MAASLPAGNAFAPTEFSPPRTLVRIAAAVLAVAGVAGLWRGAAEAILEGPYGAPPPRAADVRAPPVVASPLPAIGATADTLLPPAALGPTVPPAPAPARPAPRTETATAPPAPPVAEPRLIVGAEPAVRPPPSTPPIVIETEPVPADDLEPPPPENEAPPPD